LLRGYLYLLYYLMNSICGNDDESLGLVSVMKEVPP